MVDIPKTEASGPSPEEEIKELERKLQEKKQELAGKSENPAEEKEILREVLQKHIEKEKNLPIEDTSSPAPAISHILTDDLQKQADDVKKKESQEEQVKHLVEIALTKGIKEAVSVAGRVNPFLVDELHDHLVDDYYAKLVSLRKIKQL